MYRGKLTLAGIKKDTHTLSDIEMDKQVCSLMMYTGTIILFYIEKCPHLEIYRDTHSC